MNNYLRYVGISHKTASIGEREKFHVSEEERELWVNSIRSLYEDIKGLLLLVTCNRTEIYLESSKTSAGEIRDFMIREIFGSQCKYGKSLFRVSDDTQETVMHLLEVSSGLSSKVLGDAEIIHQIKMAYKHSCRQGLQGSLLERCMQSVFKSHKRISNETAFRDGTTSVAYKTLKLITNTFDQPEKDSLKILCLGAGDIVRQLLNYNNKFGFSSIYVSNRTSQKAEELTEKFGGHTYDWDRVLDNDFMDFNVIISAVSNRPNLVSRVARSKETILLLDLAVPGNIDKHLSEESHIIHYNLDTIAKALKENKKSRLKSIKKVEAIIREELHEFLTWLQDAPYRKSIGQYKKEVDNWLNSYLQQNRCRIQDNEATMVINRIIRKSINQQCHKISEQEMELILEEHL